MTVRTTTQANLKPLSVKDYYALFESGIITAADRVELIHGKIIRMSPIGSMHGGYVKLLNRILNQALAEQSIIGVQDPVRLSTFSEPEPDISVLHLRDDSYTESHPTAEDVFFLIEVADTSVGYDFDEKLPLYAAAGIPEVWILDVQARQITQHTQPDANVYLLMDTYQAGMRLRCTVLDFELDLSRIFRG